VLSTRTSFFATARRPDAGFVRAAALVNEGKLGFDE
jgi:hypothetical protein